LEKKLKQGVWPKKMEKEERPVGMRRYMIWLRGLLQYADSMFQQIIGAMNRRLVIQGFWW